MEYSILMFNILDFSI